MLKRHDGKPLKGLDPVHSFVSEKAVCDRHCEHCLEKLCTHGIPIFASLDYTQLTHIAELTVHRNAARGEVIIEDGDCADFVAIIREGRVKAGKYTQDGREQILYMFDEGDFFGEQHLLSDRPSRYRVTALKATRLCLLYRKDFHTLLRTFPDIGIRIIGELGWRLSHLENAMQHIGVRNLDSRISLVLLELAARYGEETPEGTLLRLPFSRNGLASYIGIARETISRKMGQLESRQVIRSLTHRAILLKNRAALEESAGELI